MTVSRTLEQRIDRIESRLAIGELPTRYARAVDGRDIDTWISLFPENVNCGKLGIGREALRRHIEPAVRTFYRSVHLICGHTVDFLDDNTAEGTTYCRAEHEDGDQWVSMAIIYFDQYIRQEGTWYFERRREKHWYAFDERDRKPGPFQQWDKWPDAEPELPGHFPTWSLFWEKADAADISALTRIPVVANSGWKA